MTATSHTSPRSPAASRPRPAAAPGVPFSNAEEAWFWFVQAQEAKSAGARVIAGAGLIPRPCEPGDIHRTVDRLYRQRKLLRDHLNVMVHYGRRLMPPDATRDREYRAAQLWREAFTHLAPALRDKGIIAGGDIGPDRPEVLQ